MEKVGLIRVASTGKWLSTSIGEINQGPAAEAIESQTNGDTNTGSVATAGAASTAPPAGPAADQTSYPATGTRMNRVFITHGKNKAFITPIKDLLSFGQLDAIVSVERESVAQPVPDKVMNDMRTCGAAIIHIEDEVKLLDEEAKQHVVLNQNVLIEIGAAMALYGRRFILLVKEGVELPSNLRGLYEVRYGGEKLDGEVTIRLLKAINEMKKERLPASDASASK
jgi:predicted nucleotide-binding protein